jgi:hypothetical protein
VRYREVLNGVNEDRNIVHTLKRRTANWICHILSKKRHSKKHAIEENMGKSKCQKTREKR